MLLAAKVLVVSRLLHKKLFEGNAHQEKKQYIEGIRSRLAKLRQKLLNSIDATLGSIGAGQPVLVQAMCAFALATSSSARDVLRHFHQLRAEAIVSHMRSHQSGDVADLMVSAMQLWIRSIQDTHAIFPRQLSAALIKMKAIPLFNGDDVRGIVEMDHEVHAAWVGEDIRNFTPYVRHDDLDSDTIEKLLGSWAPMALGRYLQSIQALLEDVEDYDTVVLLRKKTLDLLFSNHSHVVGIDRRQVVDSLRDTFKKRLLEIMRNRCSSLAAVGQSIQFTLQSWETDPPEVSTDLWDKSLPLLDTTHGAPVLIDTLKSRLHGTSTSSTMISQHFQRWLRNVQYLEKSIGKMRETKWEEEDDDLDADLDEDEDDFSARHDLLSVQDPKTLSEGLESSAKDATSNLQNEMDEMIRSLGDNNTTAKAAFLLRLLRDSLAVPSIKVNIPVPALFCLPTSLSYLYDVLATHVTLSSVEACSPVITRFLARQDLPQRTLWEGMPELPVLPSSWTFRILQTHVREMGALGIDLWAKGAVDRVKTVMGKYLGELLSEGLRNMSSETDSGKEGIDEDKDREKDQEMDEAAGDSKTAASKFESLVKETRAVPLKDRETQLAFDLAYFLQATSLQAASSSTHAAPQSPTLKSATYDQDNNANMLQSVYEEVLSDLALMPEEKKRIENGAAEYWKRTNLLFALLS